MKHYIFITYSILGVGGGQCYVAGKAKYLEQEGWHVVVISDGPQKGNRKCPIDYLDKFIPCLMPEVGIIPTTLTRLAVKLTLRKFQKLLGKISSGDEVIIESHDDRTALWGELLANRLNGRHFFYTLNERYRGENKYYEDRIDFYLFKYQRNEILSSAKTINRLFEGYLEVQENEIEALLIDEDPVQDVQNSIVDSIEKCDYNICYIGRAVKPYVPNIIEGVGEFASKHKEKNLQFVIVGDASSQKERLEAINSANDNLTITELGPLHPLPKSLFSKIDVVIAGSGSARCSVEEGTLTIVADPESKQALGLLGYDTNNSVYRDEDSIVTTFGQALNRALIDKVHLRMPFKYPAKMGVAECTMQNFRLMNKGDRNKVYYDEPKLLEGKKDYRLSLSLLLHSLL